MEFKEAMRNVWYIIYLITLVASLGILWYIRGFITYAVECAIIEHKPKR